MTSLVSRGHELPPITPIGPTIASCGSGPPPSAMARAWKRCLAAPHELRRNPCRRAIRPPAAGGPPRGTGSGRPGDGASRPRRGTAHQGRQHRGCLVRPGLRPRAGPPVPDGAEPPPRPGPRRRMAGRVRLHRRCPGPPVGGGTGQPARLRRPGRRGSADVRALRRRHQCIQRLRRPAGVGIPAARCHAGTLGRLAQHRGDAPPRPVDG